MAKKKYIKSYAYIRSLIWKTYPEKAKSWTNKTFLKQVSEVYNLCKKRCTKKFILNTYLKIQRKKQRRDDKIGLKAYNQIKSFLYASFGPDFQNYRDPLLREATSLIYEDCKKRRRMCSHDDIIEMYEKFIESKRPPKPDALGPDLFGPLPYWEIKDVEFADRLIFPEYLWVVSPMILAKPHEFASGDYGKGSYYDYFSDWVDWCNEAVNEGLVNEYDINFMLLPVNWNSEKNRWEVEIVIVTSLGEIFSFGYKPVDKDGPSDVDKDFIKPSAENLAKRSELQKSPDESVDAKSRIRDERMQKEIDKLKAELHDIKKAKRDEKLKEDIMEARLLRGKIKKLTKLKKELVEILHLYKELNYKAGMKKVQTEIDEIIAQIAKLRKQ